MAKISINELFDELSDENNRLLNELLFAQKCIQLFESFVFRLKVVNNKCKCDQRINNKVLFKDLENSYKCLFEKFSKTLELNNFVNNKDLINNTIHKTNRFQTNGIDFECEKFDTNYEKKNKSEGIVNNEESVRYLNDLNINESNVCNNGSQTQPKDEDFGSDYKAINCNESQSFGKSFKQIIKEKKAKKKSKVYHKCDYFECNETFCSIIGLNKHKKDIHCLEEYKSSAKYYQKIKYWRCDQIGCNFKTKHNWDFMAHKNIHLGLKPYKCPINGCEKSFLSYRNLLKHQKYFHLLKKNIICEFIGCEKKFKTKPQMKRHFKLHFDREKNFICDYINCEFKAVSKTALKAHKIKHTNDRPFSCTIDGCDKSYKTETNLKLHLLSHKNISFKCTFNGCEKSFRSKEYLKTHELMHKNELPLLSCDWPGCEYTTYSKAHLKTHRNGVHSSQSNYVCDWPECGKRFKFNVNLKLHQRIHNNDKRYVCHWPGCQYRCVDLANFRKHFKIHSK